MIKKLPLKQPPSPPNKTKMTINALSSFLGPFEMLWGFFVFI
jgi:hypothetical protein